MSDDIVSRDGQTVGSWDGQDINDLKAALATIRKQHKVAPKDIPHQDQLPEDLRNFTAYLLWGCDKNQNCLVGSGANRIESVDSIREFYGNQIAKDAQARRDS